MPVMADLAAPFAAGEVKFKPQSVKGNRALALAYIDARVIQDRLDDVAGVENWMDDYEILADGSVMCRLRIKADSGEWVTKVDVGSPSEQPDGGDRLKAAFSDALKRAAVKFGIGRYLYRLPAVWCDYDQQKKQFTQRPQLPSWAMPPAANANAKAKPVANPYHDQEDAAPPPAPAKAPVAPPAPTTVGELWGKMSDMQAPTTGADLVARLSRADLALVRLAGLEPNTLIDAVCEFAKAADLAAMKQLTGQPLVSAWNNARNFVKSHDKQHPAN